MKATVVIPNLNGAGWLRDSIESVWAQTEQDFELIVVDNGSTDESLAIARSYRGRANYTLIENAENTVQTVYRQPLSLFGFPLPATVETTLCREVTPQEYTVSETLACDLARNAVLRQAEQDFGEIELLDLTMDTTTQEDSLTARFHLRFIANIAKSVPFGGLTGN